MSTSEPSRPEPIASSYPGRRPALETARRRSMTDGEPWTVVELLRHRGWHTAISSRLLADPAVRGTDPYRTVAVFNGGRRV